MYYVYFLRLSNNEIYVDSMNVLRKRIYHHPEGLVKSTKPYLPVNLLSCVSVCTDKKARELEKYFKTWSGKAILKKRILTNEVSV